MPADLLAEDSHEPANQRVKKPNEYMVVARRYRPQNFEQLIGQKNVSQALSSAITTHRVGHAYLFTGARGVGKTSTARIFAKALNCVQGPTLTPCGECDICQGIASGDDVDVIEIDGASNRGIDEIRQLRQNVNIRPSRARFKIHIIDEVHMLTTAAFNALLKTLEEPPEHVKFIFCTTEADKIPITVLSRCQRFDFAPMEMSSITSSLTNICRTEGIEAEPEALQIIARRAAGSMRDSQSLLEQLLSFGTGLIAAADVHAMLGTAQTGRLLALAQSLRARQASTALQQLDTAVNEGVDVGQLAEQLLGFFRDMAAATLGCGADLMLHCSAADLDAVAVLGRQWGLETVLAIVQILDHAVVRMRQSTHVRTLVEMALIRICTLENLDELSGLVAQLRGGNGSNSVLPRSPTSTPGAKSTPPVVRNSPSQQVRSLATDNSNPAAIATDKIDAQKKNDEPPELVETAKIELSTDPLNAADVWHQTIKMLEDSGDMAAEMVKLCHEIATIGPNTLAATFPGQYTYQKAACERPDRKSRLEAVATQVAGRKVKIEFRLGAKTEARPNSFAPPAAPTLTQKAQQKREKERNPIVRQAMELFEAEIERVLEPERVESLVEAVAEGGRAGLDDDKD